ncbi:MAG: hypothetical protein AAGM22_07055 [Acidobacteriota bacterium]
MIGLDELDHHQLRELLLDTAEDRADGRFFERPRLHPAVELQHHYDRADYEGKARLKAALTEAVAEWRARAHGGSSLRFLAQAAAALRARTTAPHFERLLRLHRLLSEPADSTFAGAHLGDVAADVTATVAGFAPGDDIGALLERLFFSTGLRPELAGVLLQGLCRARRAELPRWLRRYVELVDGTDVRHFENPVFLRLFVESLTPPSLVNAWPDLDAELREFLLEDLSRLRRDESPDLYFALDSGGVTLHVQIADREEKFELRSNSVDQLFDDLSQAYDLFDLPPAVH